MLCKDYGECGNCVKRSVGVDCSWIAILLADWSKSSTIVENFQALLIDAGRNCKKSSSIPLKGEREVNAF